MTVTLDWTSIGVIVAILSAIIGGLIWLVRKLQELEDRIQNLEDNPILKYLTEYVSKKNIIAGLGKVLKNTSVENPKPQRGKK